MSRLYLVRHGRAAAGWTEDSDPGLDDVGHAQAAAVGERLASLGQLPIVTSPLRRCRETATPLAARWDVEPVVDPAVGEIPSPEGLGLAQRGSWLAQVMAGRWPPEMTPWRDSVGRALLRCERDTVVFSHFVAINVAIGRATGDDRVVIFRPDNTSVTVLDTDGQTLTLVTPPGEATTDVL